MKTKLILLVSIVSVILLSIISCTPSHPTPSPQPQQPAMECAPGDTKCEEYNLYICNSEGKWELLERYCSKCGWQPNIKLDVYAGPPRVKGLPPSPPPPYLEVPVEITITCDAPISLTADDLHIKVYSSYDQTIKTEVIPGATIPAHGTQTFLHSFVLDLDLEILEIIRSGVIIIKVDTEVGISGIKMIPVEGQFILELPPLPQFPF